MAKKRSASEATAEVAEKPKVSRRRVSAAKSEAAVAPAAEGKHTLRIEHCTSW